MSAVDNICCSCAADDKNINSNLTGIKLFKSMVRRVRQKITESKLVKSPSGNELSSVITKTERMSLDESSSGNRTPTDTVKSFGTLHNTDDKSRISGYSSDSGTEKSRRSSRVRIRQKIRSRSKSDGRRIEKKPKKILRAPPTYIHVRGLSGIPTQRIRVR